LTENYCTNAADWKKIQNTIEISKFLGMDIFSIIFSKKGHKRDMGHRYDWHRQGGTTNLKNDSTQHSYNINESNQFNIDMK